METQGAQLAGDCGLANRFWIVAGQGRKMAAQIG
jgi:hypothetical protein